MKILQICHRVPYPPVDGGNIAMMNMALALIDAGHEVHQFALNTRKHFVNPIDLPIDLKAKLHFHATPIDTTIKISGVLKNIFTSDSYNVIRFYSTEAEKELQQILIQGSFDIVQLETLFATPYISCIRKHSSAKIVLRAHNVEHIIWERLAETENNIIRKWYLHFLAKRLKKYELETLEEIDAIIPITPVDELLFKNYHFLKPVLTVPVSLTMNDYVYDEKVKPEMSLFHLGSMDWIPNREAVEWFLKEVWPGIHSLYPTLRLYLAGRNFPDEIKNAGHPNAICQGRIEDAHSYMQTKQVMIVPLHSGSGMRVKIIQGMALGKTILSTTVGAEGIPVTNGENILIANTPSEFISQVKWCMENPEASKEIGKKARKFAEDNYSNFSVGKQLSVFFKNIMAKKNI
jgi:glycosyltransferase involved in cell wall biosynthesis